MKLSEKALDLFFRHMDPEHILLGMFRGAERKRQAGFKDAFLTRAEITLHGYSSDEQDNIFNYCCQLCEERAGRNDLPPFYLLVDYAASVLVIGRDSIVCRLRKAMEWRECYLLLGQDIFTTSLLASRPLWEARRDSFAWPAVLPVDDAVLRRTLNGIAENHMHLFAAASTFSLNWSCLMNYPEMILRKQSPDSSMDRLLQPHTTRHLGERLWTQRRRVITAAYIRCLLFSRLHGEDARIGERLRRFFLRYGTDEYMCGEVSRYASYLRHIYGVPFPQPDAFRSECLDYAFSNDLIGDLEAHMRLPAGERYFLYACFRKCFQEEFSLEEQWIFYAYLLLKSQLRGEFVQLNGQTGFRNFQFYDKRKYMLWGNLRAYWNESYRQALNAPLHEQSISSLESRLSPGDSVSGNIALLHYVDRAKLFYDADSFQQRWKIGLWRPSLFMDNPARDQKYFFVYHFSKEADRRLPERGASSLRCRHEEYRKMLRRKAIAVAKSLSNCPYLSHRIRGIDACSNELWCRPEVFSSVFRFLRNFPARYYRNLFSMDTKPVISFTYHVGEDFFDIADGLRAMDEALCFLGFRRGDRFGHALALGVDPTLHYARKHQQLILSKQDLLDNLVWICFRSVELNVEIPSNLKSELLALANVLFWEIYEPVLIDRASTLEDYYKSMLLRGDTPFCYASGNFRNLPIADPFDAFAANDNPALVDRLRHYRRESRLTYLYCCYHYNTEVRRAGAKLVRFDITPEYTSLMEDMQKAMRRYINDCGIRIECNPSSNVLIGTFASYQKHPILTFNNLSLNLPHSDVQMHVSINTDDPGVFDTSLSFEYALLAQAIGEMTDENGKPLHSDREIENYLNQLVRMGREQCFPSLSASADIS